MSKFTVNTHHAYLNNYIFVKCNGPISIVDKNTGQQYEFSDELKIRLSAGKHILASDDHEEEIVIEDAIKLGGGRIKKSFVFDDSPWLFVTTYDRLYIHNRETNEEIVEYNITPDLINSLDSYHGDSNFFLFQTEDDYAIYDVKKGSIVFTYINHIYANDHLVIYKDADEVIVYDYIEDYDVARFSGLYSFGNKFYFVKNEKLCGLNLNTSYINAIEFVGDVHKDDVLISNYLIKLEKDHTYGKTYGYYYLGNGEKYMSKTTLKIPHYIFKWKEYDTPIFQKTYEAINRFNDENEDLLNGFDLVDCMCLGININKVTSCWEKNKKMLCLFGEIVACPEINYHIPFTLHGVEKETIDFKDVIFGQQMSDNKDEGDEEETEDAPNLDLNHTEELLAQSNSKLLLITIEDKKLFLRDTTTDSRIEILKDCFDHSSFNNAYFTSDGKNVILRISKTEIQLLGINDYQSMKYEVDGFTVSRNEGINGYKPVIAQFDGRKPVWKDPITLDIVSENDMSSHVYKSPDGQYCADINMEKIQYNTLTKSEITNREVNTIENKYNWSWDTSEKEKEEKIQTRRELVSKYDKSILFAKLIDFQKKIIQNDSYLQKHCIGEIFEKRVDREIERKITNSSNFTNLFIDNLFYVRYKGKGSEYKRILIGRNAFFLNYVSFSYDSKYLSFAAKMKGDEFRSSQEGVFEIYDLENDKIIKRIEEIDNQRLWAVWMAIFNKSGDVAFYDSKANAYLLTKSTSYESIVEASGKSLLCFSPSGKYIACSDQNYIDFEHHPEGNWGHQPSGNVFIHITEDFERPIEQYNDLGEGISGVASYAGSVSSAAFSQDEKRLLVVGDDGVVVIRNLKITTVQDSDGKEGD